MNPIEETNMLVQRLIDAWGQIVVSCGSGKCTLWGIPGTIFEAPTLMDALRMAAADLENFPVCRVCGCTDDTPCEGGCYWVEPDLCSACTERESA